MVNFYQKKPKKSSGVSDLTEARHDVSTGLSDTWSVSRAKTLQRPGDDLLVRAEPPGVATEVQDPERDPTHHTAWEVELLARRTVDAEQFARPEVWDVVEFGPHFLGIFSLRPEPLDMPFPGTELLAEGDHGSVVVVGAVPHEAGSVAGRQTREHPLQHGGGDTGVMVTVVHPHSMQGTPHATELGEPRDYGLSVTVASEQQQMLSLTNRLLLRIRAGSSHAVPQEPEVHPGIRTVGVKRSVEHDVRTEPAVDGSDCGFERRFSFFLLWSQVLHSW